MNLSPIYSPIKAWKEWQERRQARKSAPAGVINPGVLAEYRRAVELADVAEEFLKSRYHSAFLEYLELKAKRLYEDFHAGKLEKAEYLGVADFIREVAEHPLRLIRSGQAAAQQLSDWDQHGLTGQVADADASRAQGDPHAGTW